MDAITSNFIFLLADDYPLSAITLTHQFLDGRKGVECGLVPNNWDGSELVVTGQWWKEVPNTSIAMNMPNSDS